MIYLKVPLQEEKKKPDVLNSYWLEWGLQENVLSISHYTGVGKKKEICFSVAIKPQSLWQTNLFWAF